MRICPRRLPRLSPFLGIHTLLGVLLAFLFDLNRVAVLLGVYSNLPWIIAAYYTTATMVGAFITRDAPAAAVPEGIVQLFEHSFRTATSGISFTLIWPLLGRMSSAR